MPDLIGTLTVPVRLVGRALEDVHTLAKASGEAVEREERWKEMMQSLQDRVSGLQEATKDNSQRQHELADQLDALNVRLGTILEKIETVEEVLPGRQEFIAEAQRIREEVRTLAEAAQPVGDAAGRVERIASRLPGGG